MHICWNISMHIHKLLFVEKKFVNLKKKKTLLWCHNIEEWMVCDHYRVGSRGWSIRLRNVNLLKLKHAFPKDRKCRSMTKRLEHSFTARGSGVKRTYWTQSNLALHEPIVCCGRILQAPLWKITMINSEGEKTGGSLCSSIKVSRQFPRAASVPFCKYFKKQPSYRF